MLSNEIFHIMKESNIERFTFKGDSITLIQGDNPELAFVISFISPIVVGLTLAIINTFIIIPYVIQIAAIICILVCLFTLFFRIHKVTYEVSLSSPITSGYGPFIKKVGTSDYRKKILDENTFAALSKSERSNFICSLREEVKKRSEVKEEILYIKDFLSGIKMKIKAEKEVSEIN